MTDYIEEIIALVESKLPELGNRIQPAAVDAKTPTPYVAFTEPIETPIRTIDGIVGYDMTFQLAIVDKLHSQALKLKHKLIETLESFMSSSKQRCALEKSESRYYEDQDLHGFIITFNIY